MRRVSVGHGSLSSVCQVLVVIVSCGLEVGGVADVDEIEAEFAVALEALLLEFRPS